MGNEGWEMRSENEEWGAKMWNGNKNEEWGMRNEELIVLNSVLTPDS